MCTEKTLKHRLSCDLAESHRRLMHCVYFTDFKPPTKYLKKKKKMLLWMRKSENTKYPSGLDKLNLTDYTEDVWTRTNNDSSYFIWCKFVLYRHQNCTKLSSRDVTFSPCLIQKDCSSHNATPYSSLRRSVLVRKSHPEPQKPSVTGFRHTVFPAAVFLRSTFWPTSKQI